MFCVVVFIWVERVVPKFVVFFLFEVDVQVTGFKEVEEYDDDDYDDYE